MDFITTKLTDLKTHVFHYYLHYLCLGFLVIIALAFLPQLRSCVPSTSVTVLGHGFTVLAVLFAGFQIKAEHDWNRRQLAFTTAKEIREASVPYIGKLEEIFGMSNRRKHEKLTVDEIHKEVCKTDDSGKYIYKNGKLILDTEGEGTEISAAITHYLGSFEHLACGIRQGVLDEEVIYSLYGGPLIRAGRLFEDYIEHVNTDMFPGRRGRIYRNLILIQEKFEEREKDMPEQERPGSA